MENAFKNEWISMFRVILVLVVIVLSFVASTGAVFLNYNWIILKTSTNPHWKYVHNVTFPFTNRVFFFMDLMDSHQIKHDFVFLFVFVFFFIGYLFTMQVSLSLSSNFLYRCFHQFASHSRSCYRSAPSFSLFYLQSLRSVFFSFLFDVISILMKYC